MAPVRGGAGGRVDVGVGRRAPGTARVDAERAVSVAVDAAGAKRSVKHAALRLPRETGEPFAPVPS
jgi:hypothetical protein